MDVCSPSVPSRTAEVDGPCDVDPGLKPPIGGFAVDAERREWLIEALGEAVCRRLGIFRVPADLVLSVVIPCYKRMSRGKRPTIRGVGDYIRDFIYAGNVVAANLAAVRHPGPLGGEVFNVWTGERIRLLDLVAWLNRIDGTELEPEFRSPRAGDVRDSLASPERIGRVLGYRPLVPFDEGLRRTVEAGR
jgi:nucleoside-diphosphate-sugar epimerase